jgi:hypothetical protein
MSIIFASSNTAPLNSVIICCTTIFFFWFVRLLARRPLLAYCASLGWQWRWLWRADGIWICRGNRSSRRKPAPAPLLSITKSHMPKSGFEPRTAAVGSRRLTAWAMARPLYYHYYYIKHFVQRKTLHIWGTNWLICLTKPSQNQSQSQSQSRIATDGQSVSKSWCQAPSGAHDQIFIAVWQLQSCYCGTPSLTIGRVCLLSESLPALVSHLS